MNLASTIILLAGGMGSGCQGENCGRPSGTKAKVVVYHGTSLKAAQIILKEGLKPQEGNASKSVYASEDKGIAAMFAKAGGENFALIKNITGDDVNNVEV